MNKHARKIGTLATRIEQGVNTLMDLREETPAWSYQVSKAIEKAMEARAELAQLSRRMARHATPEAEEIANEIQCALERIEEMAKRSAPAFAD